MTDSSDLPEVSEPEAAIALEPTADVLTLLPGCAQAFAPRVVHHFAGGFEIGYFRIEIAAEQMRIPGFSQPLVFKKDERFKDML